MFLLYLENCFPCRKLKTIMLIFFLILRCSNIHLLLHVELILDWTLIWNLFSSSHNILFSCIFDYCSCSIFIYRTYLEMGVSFLLSISMIFSLLIFISLLLPIKHYRAFLDYPLFFSIYFLYWSLSHFLPNEIAWFSYVNGFYITLFFYSVPYHPFSSACFEITNKMLSKIYCFLYFIISRLWILSLFWMLH